MTISDRGVGPFYAPITSVILHAGGHLESVFLSDLRGIRALVAHEEAIAAQLQRAVHFLGRLFPLRWISHELEGDAGECQGEP
jgi:hypothetical protein